MIAAIIGDISLLATIVVVTLDGGGECLQFFLLTPCKKYNSQKDYR